MMVMLPFWTSFLLRVYAWKGILADQGVLNKLLISVGLIAEPIQMLYTNVSMLVGMTYVYLPFMISLDKQRNKFETLQLYKYINRLVTNRHHYPHMWGIELLVIALGQLLSPSY